MVPEVGQRFGPYEILGRLGGGGMGLVFRAWDERLHREVAVKLLHDDYTMPGMRERFLQEARAASALNHPNICTVFDIGEQDQNPYLVMELLEGETVKDRIAHGALSAEEIVRYAMEITNALSAAHSKGIVHRDIKPANIFLVGMPNGKSQAKVLDFGLAKIRLEMGGGWGSRTLDLTLAGATVGTLAYMSPEQARGESLDIRSDLFSLGIVLYEMATRQVPFRGTTSALLFVHLFSHTPEPVRNWNESIPRELEKIILKLLEKDRKKRFQTSEELHDALLKISGKLGRGGWLNRGLTPPVPLVRANDPVARHKGPKRKPERAPSDGQVEAAPAVAGSSQSSGSMVIRPMRVLAGDLSIEHKVAVPARQGAVALESGTMPAELHTVNGEVTESDSAVVVIPQRQEQDATRVVQARPVETVLAQSASGVTQFEYDFDDVDLERAQAEALANSADRELIEISLAMGARTKKQMLAVSGLILVGVMVVVLMQSGVFRPLVLGSKDHLLLTMIQNKTSDKSLDGTVMQGIEIALRQSRSLNVLGGEAYRAGLRQIESESGDVAGVAGQRVAQKVGARAYVYGEIRESGKQFTVSVDVLKTDSNDKVATLQETAASREEIPAAIGKIAQDIRVEVSEDRKVQIESSVALQTEATANLDALHAYAAGEAAMQNGRTGDALTGYQEAAKLDPKFVQAQMRLSWLYRSEKAEVASASAADLARIAAVDASEQIKLSAQFCYEMNATGDYVKALEAIRLFVSLYPIDVDGMRGLATALRVQGLLPEALLAAQQGYGEHPFDGETYAEAELAMIGMDRYDNALQLQAQAARAGVRSGGNALVVGYLDGKETIVEERANAMQRAAAGTTNAGDAPVSFAELYRFGVYLDNTGRMAAGSELWRTIGTRAARLAGLESTEASMLAQGALDRALTESCTVALTMVNAVKSMPKGPVASFNAGMAAALCGDEPYAEKTIAALRQSYPKNTAVVQYYVPQLQAAAQLGINEPGKALQSLIALGQFDEISLTPYLRGMAHATLGQMPLSIQDFQTVLAHRGSAMLLGGNVYPMAALGVARADAANRDRMKSAIAYRQFLMLWAEADRGQPLMIEALAKSR
jgi:serine/threonine protein kinase/tetratricopeptide (TPR) repeat protein